MIRTLTLALLLASACGGKQKPKAGTGTGATGTSETAREGDGDDHVHTGLPDEMNQFHELLRPLWHAEAGPKRMPDTCAAVPQLETSADAVAKATPPLAANADTWTNGTRALVAAVGDVKTACKGTDGGAFEAAFKKLHEAFHALMMAANAGGKGPGNSKGPDQPGGGTGSGGHTHDHGHGH